MDTHVRETGMRNYTIAARVWAGTLSSDSYKARISADEEAAKSRFARTYSMTRPELSEQDLERIRTELPGKIALLASDLRR